MDFWQYVGVILSVFFAYMVYKDAKDRGNNSATFWAIGAFLAWIIVLPIYWLRSTGKFGKQ